MANQCNNLIIMSNTEFTKIQHLFSESEVSYDPRPFLDLDKIIPLPKDAALPTLLGNWGCTSNTFCTHIEVNGEETWLNFLTKWNCPIPALEKMVVSCSIQSMRVYALEGGCLYGVAGEIGLDDDGLLDVQLDIGEFAMDEACEVMFDTTLEEYMNPEGEEDEPEE